MSDDQIERILPPQPTPEAMASVPFAYVNGLAVTLAAYDFTVTFMHTVGGKADPVFRAEMSPQLAKVFAAILRHHVEEYETKIGPIEIKEGFVPGYDLVRKQANP